MAQHCKTNQTDKNVNGHISFILSFVFTLSQSSSSHHVSSIAIIRIRMSWSGGSVLLLLLFCSCSTTSMHAVFCCVKLCLMRWLILHAYRWFQIRNETLLNPWSNFLFFHADSFITYDEANKFFLLLLLHAAFHKVYTCDSIHKKLTHQYINHVT